MKRLKSLLDSYEKDMCYRESMGLSKMSYTSWAKLEAKRSKKEEAASTNKKSPANSPGNGQSSLELPTAFNKSIAVEITKESFTPKKSKRKSKKREFNEWRLAKRARPGLFVPNTQVICMVECKGGDDHAPGADYEFFIGTIMKLVDGHVKVHLTGLNKKDDIWLDQDSDHLFLDGGVTDAPTDGAKKNRRY